MPKRRSASRASAAGSAAKGWRVASITTKSLPAPCILVKASFMTREPTLEAIADGSANAEARGRLDLAVELLDRDEAAEIDRPASLRRELQLRTDHPAAAMGVAELLAIEIVV